MWDELADMKSAPIKLILEHQRLLEAGDFAALDPLLLPSWQEQLETLLDNDERS